VTPATRTLVRGLLWQPLVLYCYLCAPRTLLVWRAPSTELQLTRGFLDQTLAYVGVLLAIFHLIAFVKSPRLRSLLVRIFLAWIQIDFLIRCGEAALMYQFDIGYSSLFFYHLQWESARLALSQYWRPLLAAAASVVVMDRLFRRLFVIEPPPASARTRVAAVLLILFGVRCTFVLVRERRRAREDFAAASLVLNWQTYFDQQKSLDRVHLTDAERAYVRTYRIGLRRMMRPPIRTYAPERRLNLITIYLEGFQANFSQSGRGPFPGLTPNLDQFAVRSVFMSSFYNAVTPTINALVSSECGILAQVENESLITDRGYTRNITCLSDVLHDAGYHQEFFGGADSGFSGKRLFLTAHHFDQVWGWEEWRHEPTYADQNRRNAWGLNDTDLVREVIDRLPSLTGRAPFHLSMLTVNTHQPGFQAPDCPEYAQGRVMLNAIHCTDYAIGMLVHALDAGGYLKNTAVVIMGDHTMFPTPENAIALGPAASDWFGKVFMTVYWPAGPHPGRIDSPSYTPDFAPIALEALGFTPLPRFAFGRSPLTHRDPRRMLIASHFQIQSGTMTPAHPTLDNGCSIQALEHTTLSPATLLSPCGREKIIDSVDEVLLSAHVPQRNSTN
jgi:phosphoglycerol transferase MdoB-like AlkP superfamily enzyme